MSAAQEVFRKVISAGFYFGDHQHTRWFMCHALNKALGCEVISEEEYFTAKEEIYSYIRSHGGDHISLGAIIAIWYAPLYRDDGNYTEIYWDWDVKRPIPMWQEIANSCDKGE